MLWNYLHLNKKSIVGNLKWKREDYLNAYCDLGFEEYIKFKKFYNDIKEFTISLCWNLQKLRFEHDN